MEASKLTNNVDKKLNIHSISYKSHHSTFELFHYSKHSKLRV